MTEVILHLGSNLGFREINLELSRIMISNHIGLIDRASEVYETAPWGEEEQGDFLNQALACSTLLKAAEVLSAIQRIEGKMGRIRKQKWGARIIDIDIIFYGDEIIENHNLKIPHPELTNRSFVLRPLLDICPYKVHPVLYKSIEELSGTCTDTAKVWQYNS